jgi:hypothetical protein
MLPMNAMLLAKPLKIFGQVFATTVNSENFYSHVAFILDTICLNILNFVKASFLWRMNYTQTFRVLSLMNVMK